MRNPTFTQIQVIEALPVDKWFFARDVDLDMNKGSLLNRLRKFPLLQSRVYEHAQTRVQFYLPAADKRKLIKLKTKEDPDAWSDLKTKQVIKPYKRTDVDKLWNLALGYKK